MTEHDERLLDGEGDEEYLEDYHYQDWGVDRVDLDFKSGNTLQMTWRGTASASL